MRTTFSFIRRAKVKETDDIKWCHMYVCTLAYIPWKGIPFWVHYCTWCKIRVQLHSFVHGHAVFPTEWSAILVKGPWTKYARVYSELSILFHWSICLSLCQHHTSLVTVALQYVLRSGSMSPQHFYCLSKLFSLFRVQSHFFLYAMM